MAFLWFSTGYEVKITKYEIAATSVGKSGQYQKTPIVVRYHCFHLLRIKVSKLQPNQSVTGAETFEMPNIKTYRYMGPNQKMNIYSTFF